MEKIGKQKIWSYFDEKPDSRAAKTSKFERAVVIPSRLFLTWPRKLLNYNSSTGSMSCYSVGRIVIIRRPRIKPCLKLNRFVLRKGSSPTQKSLRTGS